MIQPIDILLVGGYGIVGQLIAAELVPSQFESTLAGNYAVVNGEIGFANIDEKTLRWTRAVPEV